VEITASVATVALIIPNWNGTKHLDVCLASIAAQSKRPDRTFLVDNGSSDGSVAFVAGNFPWVKCITLPRNVGFAAAVNRGIEASDEDFLALLNNDTELDVHWLGEMVRELESDASAGMVACKMLRFDERTTIDAAGDALTRGGSPLTLGAGEQDGEKFNHRRYVPGTCAGAALYRRKMFSRIGLFDEDFVSYYEDVDLSLRAQLAGYRCLYVPTAVCYHKRGATSALLKDFPVRMQERNLTALHVKNLPASVVLMKAPSILIGRTRRLWRELLAGVGPAALVGLLQGVILIPHMLRKRKAILGFRSVPTDYIASLFGS
jgi:GT2 family glycosyltransferase